MLNAARFALGRRRGRHDEYGLRPDYRSRPEPTYFEDVSRDVVYQPDVYADAAAIGRRLGSRRIIDVGCGNAEKLMRLHPEFDIVGVDIGPNIRHCRASYAVGTWIEHDLDGSDALPLAGEDVGGSVIVAADVIEHLLRPERLLRSLRRVLDTADAVLLSTPDRGLFYGKDHTGPPKNESHVREWTRAELDLLLERHGFTTRQIGLTRTSTAEPPRVITILAIAFPDRKRLYRAQLRLSA